MNLYTEFRVTSIEKLGKNGPTDKRKKKPTKHKYNKIGKT